MAESSSPSPEPQGQQKGLSARSAVGPRSTAIIAALCAMAGSALGLLVVPRAPSANAETSPPPALTLAGEQLPEVSQAEEAGLERLRNLMGRTFSLRMPDGAVIAKSLSSWGTEIDEERFSALVSQVRDSSSSLRRHYAHVTDEEAPAPLVLPMTVALNRETAEAALLGIKGTFDRPPRDAKLNIQTRAVRDHQVGRSLDLDATMLAIDQALAKGAFEAEAVVLLEEPRVKADALKGLKFQAVLGHFETKYSRAKKAEDRTYNLRLAAEQLDGTVLLPGEEFDFNGVVGPRDEANGYKVATVIADGELVDGIGGGTCQISGTLHGAAFFAGLEIVERYPHTRPSSYIKMGMDATVVYPTINFRFRNQYDFPVAIHESVEGGVVRAEILGPSQDQVVTLIRKVDQAIPYEQLERKDSRLPKGTRILAQRGVPGFRLHRYRTIRKGSHTTREKWRDVYPPTNQVVRVGTGPASLDKKNSVGTPEYRADEVLILTQRRPVDGKPGELAENREAGKYGQRGWTKEAGMPFWDEP